MYAFCCFSVTHSFIFLLEVTERCILKNYIQILFYVAFTCMSGDIKKRKIVFLKTHLYEYVIFFLVKSGRIKESNFLYRHH